MHKVIIPLTMGVKGWYFDSKSTIYDARRFILFSFFLFSLSIVIGYNFLGEAQVVREGYVELSKKFHGDGYLFFVSKIFLHNTIIAYISMRLGILLGLIPALSGMASGIIIGWFFANANNTHWVKLLLVLAPHALFELPAMFIAWGLGFWRCKMLFVPDYDKVSKENVRQINKTFITVVVPLLVLAAIIEGWPLLLS